MIQYKPKTEHSKKWTSKGQKECTIHCMSHAESYSNCYVLSLKSWNVLRPQTTGKMLSDYYISKVKINLKEEKAENQMKSTNLYIFSYNFIYKYIYIFTYSKTIYIHTHPFRKFHIFWTYFQKLVGWLLPTFYWKESIFITPVSRESVNKQQKCVSIL